MFVISFYVYVAVQKQAFTEILSILEQYYCSVAILLLQQKCHASGGIHAHASIFCISGFCALCIPYMRFCIHLSELHLISYHVFLYDQTWKVRNGRHVNTKLCALCIDKMQSYLQMFLSDTSPDSHNTSYAKDRLCLKHV